MKKTLANMRVLLLSALVATSYATAITGTWNADFWTDYATADSGDTLVVPAAIPTAAAVYDTAIGTQLTAINTALDLDAGADYDAAAQAWIALVAACDVYSTVFATAGADSGVWPGSDANIALFKTNYEAAYAAEVTGDFGECQDAQGAAITAQANDQTACEALTPAGTFVAAQDQATPAAAAAVTDYAAHLAEWNNTNGYCETTWGLTATTIGRSLTQAIIGNAYTEAEITGVVAALDALNTTPAPSADEDSAKSPAAALAAGVAAIALLL